MSPWSQRISSGEAWPFRCPPCNHAPSARRAALAALLIGGLSPAGLIGCASHQFTISAALREAPAGTARPRTVIVLCIPAGKSNEGSGGVALDAGDGLFVTSNHVVDELNATIRVRIHGGEVPTAVVYRDVPADCAVLELTPPAASASQAAAASAPAPMLECGSPSSAASPSRAPPALEFEPPLHWGTEVYVASYRVPVADEDGGIELQAVLAMPELTGVAAVGMLGSRDANGMLIVPFNGNLFSRRLVEKPGPFDAMILDFIGQHGMSGSPVYRLDPQGQPRVFGLLRGGGGAEKAKGQFEYVHRLEWSLFFPSDPNQPLEGAWVNVIPRGAIEFIRGRR